MMTSELGLELLADVSGVIAVAQLIVPTRRQRNIAGSVLEIPSFDFCFVAKLRGDGNKLELCTFSPRGGHSSN